MTARRYKRAFATTRVVFANATVGELGVETRVQIPNLIAQKV
jgi:hypothetical protein